MEIVKIRATYVHDNLDGTYDALHHGCHLCVWERVTAHSGRHMTDSRNMSPAVRTIAVLRTHEAGRSAWRRSTSPYAWRRQTRDDAAQLFSELGISTTQAINMFLKQAVREQRIPFEVTARPTVECGSEGLG